MMLKDEFPNQFATWDIKIISTDLSDSMVKRCAEGPFSQLEVNRGLPAVNLMRHFEREGTSWRIDQSLRAKLDVWIANLISPASLPSVGSIDLVMIRNVLIYFDDSTKSKILGDIRARLGRSGEQAQTNGVIAPVRTYESPLDRRLEEAGFRTISTVTLLMKETLVRVAEPALAPAGVRSLEVTRGS